MSASSLTDTIRGLAKPIIAQASSFSLISSTDWRFLGRLRAFAQKQRRESGMLVHLDQTLAHELERGRKARGEHGRALRRLDHIGEQKVVEPAPVDRRPDQ